MEHPVCTIYMYKYTRIRALKVFLGFRGAWAAVARRLRGWFRTPVVSVRVGYGGGERVRCGRLCHVQLYGLIRPCSWTAVVESLEVAKVGVEVVAAL